MLTDNRRQAGDVLEDLVLWGEVVNVAFVLGVGGGGPERAGDCGGEGGHV